jgi:integrase
MNLPIAIERLRDAMRHQHKALSTEDSYVYWLRHYVTALSTMPNSLPSEQKLENFLTHLARHRGLAASTQNQAFNAILFFYNEVLRQPLQNINALRARRPAHLRHAPTVAETQALLQTVRDRAGYPTNLITRLLYGCGTSKTKSQLICRSSSPANTPSIDIPGLWRGSSHPTTPHSILAPTLKIATGCTKPTCNRR